jgi:hypothetical protein
MLSEPVRSDVAIPADHRLAEPIWNGLGDLELNALADTRLADWQMQSRLGWMSCERVFHPSDRPTIDARRQQHRADGLLIRAPIWRRWSMKT